MEDVVEKLLEVDALLKESITDFQVGEITEEEYRDRIMRCFSELENSKLILKESPLTVLEPPLISQAIDYASKAVYMLSSLRDADKSKAVELISKLNETYQKLRDSSFVYIDASKYPTKCATPSLNKSVNLLLNDVAQCIHNIALLIKEVESTVKPAETIEYGLCKVFLPYSKRHLADTIYNILEDPKAYNDLPENLAKDPLIKGTYICSVWNAAVDRVYGITESELSGEDIDEFALLPVWVKDIEALQGIVTEHKTYLRVGSQYGHLLEYDPKINAITYYDEDKNVREVIKDLFEEYLVVSCEDVDLNSPLSHVRCKLETTELDSDTAGIILASITSMDNRLVSYTLLDQLMKAYANRKDISKYDLLDLVRNIEIEYIGLGYNEKNIDKRKELNKEVVEGLLKVLY